MIWRGEFVHLGLVQSNAFLGREVQQPQIKEEPEKHVGQSKSWVGV
jgi:hypothetical protein